MADAPCSSRKPRVARGRHVLHVSCRHARRKAAGHCSNPCGCPVCSAHLPWSCARTPCLATCRLPLGGVRAAVPSLHSPQFATLAAMGVLNGLQRYGWFNIIRFLVIALTACGLLLIGALGVLTLTSAVVVYLSANVVSLVVALVAAIRSVSGPIRFVPALTRPLLGFGLKSHLASVSSVANERGDQLLISAFLAPQLLGLYVVAVTLTSLTNLVGGSVEVVALSRIAGERNADRQRAAARRYISRTLLGSAVISVALIAVTPQLIDIFFGSNLR